MQNYSMKYNVKLMLLSEPQAINPPSSGVFCDRWGCGLYLVMEMGFSWPFEISQHHVQLFS